MNLENYTRSSIDSMTGKPDYTPYLVEGSGTTEVKAQERAVELFVLVKDIRELLETLWSPIPYEVKPLIRRANKLVEVIEG